MYSLRCTCRMVWGLVVLGLVSVVAAAGCNQAGATLYKVKGTVTHQGKPVPELYLVFRPDDLTTKAEAVAITDENGKFELIVGPDPGCFPGKHKVIAEDPRAAQGGKTTDDPGYQAVCAKYGPDASTYEIDVNKNMYDLEVKLD